jgi:uncharacterized repeat protein (TIGR03803 family)
MKTPIKTSFLLPVLLVSLNLILAGRATAQNITTLHSFTALSSSSSGYTNSDGANPTGLFLSGDALYGTAGGGGSLGNGAIFKVSTNGTGFTTLYSFTDGGNPQAGVILSGNTLYGTESELTVRDMARSSPSTPMARVLLSCIVSLAGAADLLRMPD